MAQNFIGSNNIPLLLPNGQFGTRLQGGNDHASARYIFTQLNSITRKIFPENDDPLLFYLNEDGYQIEPLYFVPVIPMILVNGSTGIGTGWSTFIPSYDPLDIIENIERTIEGLDLVEMNPYFHNFKGSIVKQNESQYLSRGTFVQTENKISIQELPYKKWTNSFKVCLFEKMKI